MKNIFTERLRRTMIPASAVALIAFIVMLLAPPAQQVAAALDNQPVRKAEIVIQSSKVSATLADFPILLTEDTVPSEACDADGTSPAQEGGGDIRFTSDANGNNQLALEVVKFDIDNDPANCVVEIYVKVPTVSASTDTSIWMWYNTATSDSQPAVSNTYGSQNVWDSNYKGVWHLNEASGTRNDSTANANNLTDNNTVASAAGQWGTAADFESSNSEYLSIADGSQSGLDITGDLSYSVWFNLESLPSTLGTLDPLMSKDAAVFPNRSYFAFFDTDNKLYAEHYDSSNNQTKSGTDNATATTGTWVNLTVTYDVSVPLITFYINGSPVASTHGNTSATSITNSNAEFRLGGRADDLFYFDGLMQGAKLAATKRSADWISAEYNNQSDPAAFAVDQAPQQGTTAPDSSTVIKSTDESVTSSTTLQGDDDFSFALEANTKYVISGGVFATSAAQQPDIKIGFTVPTGATMDIGYLAQGGSSRTAELLETSGGASNEISISANENAIIQPFGSVVTGGTAGNLVFQWAQNTSNATATTVKQGSFISVTRVTE